MRGRPPKLSNPKLAIALRKWLNDEELSARAAAKRLNVNVATVTRALKDGRFSAAFRSSVSAATGMQDAAYPDVESLQEVLLLLIELGKMRDRAETAVRLALDRASPTQ